jgi:membrane-bound ClpP family serine protease
MNSMKLRLIIMGIIIAALGAILLIIKGSLEAFIGLIIVGIVLLVIGLAWKPKEKAAKVASGSEPDT